MGYAAHLGATTPHIRALYSTQLLLNFAWTPVFFVARQPLLALLNIGALVGCVGVLTKQYYQKGQTLAAGLMVPYFAWLMFAGYLTASIGVLNTWDLSNIGNSKGESSTTRPLD
jgi:tryptophan-rich sensory protein